MCKFAYISYEKKIRGSKFNDKEFLDYVKVVDEVIIDMCPLTDKFEDKYNKIFRILFKIFSNITHKYIMSF